jgi:SLT domain-containing protein
MSAISPAYRPSMLVTALHQAKVACTNENIVCLATIVMHESSWDPNAVNETDINAQEGHPSQGLAQIIPSTFQAHALPGESIDDPIDNMAAAVRYAVKRYGSLAKVPGVVALAEGRGYIGY